MTRPDPRTHLEWMRIQEKRMALLERRAAGKGGGGGVGTPGPPGTDGKPGLIWQGPWSAATTYAIGDAVAYVGTNGVVSSYIAVAAGAAHTPPEGGSDAFWQMLAQEGAPGPKGDTGAPGTGGGGAVDAQPVGTIVAWGSLIMPDGWLPADGQAISRTTYAALFAVLGTTYGAGDGSTTFNTPNLTGRFPLGQSASLSYLLGQTGGAASNTHNHYTGLGGDPNGSTYMTQTADLPRSRTSTTGSGQRNTFSAAAATTGNRRESSTFDETISTMPPYQVINWIIKAFGLTPAGGSPLSEPAHQEFSGGSVTATTNVETLTGVVTEDTTRRIGTPFATARTGGITITRAGLYDLTSYCRMATNVGTARAFVQIKRGGTGLARGAFGTNEDSASTSLAGLWCEVGDQIDLTVYQASGTDRTFTSSLLRITRNEVAKGEKGDTGPAVADTDWTTLTPLAGFTGNPKIRRIGDVVFMQGSLTGAFTALTTTTILNIPAEFCPTDNLGMAAVWTNGEYNFGDISTSGAVRVRKTATGSGTIYVNATWAMPRSSAGGSVDTGWQPIALDPAWVPFGAGYADPAVRVIGDEVYLRGMVKSVAEMTGATSYVIGTMPAGCAPQFGEIHDVVQNGIKRDTQAASAGTAHTHRMDLTTLAARLQVATTGVLSVYTAGTTDVFSTGCYVSLSGTSWYRT